MLLCRVLHHLDLYIFILHRSLVCALLLLREMLSVSISFITFLSLNHKYQRFECLKLLLKLTAILANKAQTISNKHLTIYKLQHSVYKRLQSTLCVMDLNVYLLMFNDLINALTTFLSRLFLTISTVCYERLTN